MPNPGINRKLNFSAATSGIVYDSEVLDWIDRVVANGGSVPQSTKDAANTFMVSAKAAGLRSLIHRLNLYAGTGLLSCAVPLIKDKGSTTDSLVAFTSGDYSESTGLTGSGNPGSRKFINTGFVPSTDWASDADLHTAVYSRTDSTESNNCMIGSVQSGVAATAVYLTLRISLASNTSYALLTGNNLAQTAGADPNTLGFYHASRVSSSSLVLYKNGSSIASNGGASGGLNANGLYVHAVNDSLLGDQINTAKSLAGYSIGKGMDATQSLAYYNAWQAFQTAMGRQV